MRKTTAGEFWGHEILGYIDGSNSWAKLEGARSAARYVGAPTFHCKFTRRPTNAQQCSERQGVSKAIPSILVKCQQCCRYRHE